MVEIVLVGCAHIHTPGFVKRLQARSDTRVVAVWDHDDARAARYAGELSTTVRDLDGIWHDAGIVAMVITSETNRHTDLVRAATAAGKHLFVEKPLGMGAADAYDMARTIEAAGVTFQTGFFMRGNPVHLFLREQVQAGAFGTITRLRASNCHAGLFRGFFDTEYRWMADPAVAGVGAFGDLGAHALDLLLWLTGGTVVSVAATVGNATGRFPGCDEYGEALLRFADGTVATLAAGWVDVANPVSLEICGTEGHAVVVNGQLTFQSTRMEGADGKAPWTHLPDALPHAFDLFLDALGGRDVPLVSAREAAYGGAVIEACYRAAYEGAWVTPEPQ